MIIYKFEHECYKCHEIMTVFTYLKYHDLYDDVTLPYENWMMDEVYAAAHPHGQFFDKESDALIFPVKMLGSDQALDQIVYNSKRVPNIKFIKSKLHPTGYYANVCPHCGAFLGKYHLQCAVTDNYLKGNNPMAIYCEL